jgi:hypothetical protein
MNFGFNVFEHAARSTECTLGWLIAAAEIF